jgi:hypothetical protein
MSNQPHASQKCQESAGFLFRHRCGRDAATRCDVSGVALCREHAYRVDWAALEAARLIAPAPARSAPQAVVSASVAQRLEKIEVMAAAQRGAGPAYRSRWGGSPHFYAVHCYPGYGAYDPDIGIGAHDPQDFVEGDAAALDAGDAGDAADAGDEGFEQDMSGS